MSVNDALKERAHEIMHEDPERRAIIYATLKKINEGFYDQQLVDVITQPFLDTYDVYEAFYFSKIWAEMLQGNILFAQVYTENVPAPDSEWERNHKQLQVLSQTTSPFRTWDPGLRAVVWESNTQPFDGELTWERLDVGVVTAYGERVTETWDTQRNNSAGLEIGSSSSVTLFRHLLDNYIVARWPYGSKLITILGWADKKHPVIADE